MKTMISSIMTDIGKYACMIVNEKERKSTPSIWEERQGFHLAQKRQKYEIQITYQRQF
jgi:hypothetical protein